ncbi:MAG: hypothetical protein AB8F26_11125 [Phycisphaerales bacterium]
MNPPQDDSNSTPSGMTPLVQMFPMHIGEPQPAPSRPGQPQNNAGNDPAPSTPGRSSNRAS